jgi:hypothetical protein
MPRGKLRPTLEEVKALLAQDRGLSATAGHPGRQAGAQNATGPRRPLFDRAVRALPALGEGAGGGARRDVRPGRVDQEGQGDHRAPGSQRRSRWSARSGALCGHSFSASAISAINTRLDEELARFARRRLDEACPYLIVDARCERVREAGVIRSQAVLLAIGIGWDGRRSILAVELANRERGLSPIFDSSGRREGLKAADFLGSGVVRDESVVPRKR